MGQVTSKDCNPDLNGRILKKSDHSGRSSRVLIFPSSRESGRGKNSGVRRLRVLSDLEVGESGVLVALDLPLSVQNHLMYMGFVPNARVKAVNRAPAGDPTVYSVDGIEIALRKETARSIRVSDLNPAAHRAQSISEAAR
jgi:Fe2+ transport system protein FeoA